MLAQPQSISHDQLADSLLTVRTPTEKSVE